MILLDVLFSFLLFLAASVLIIVYLLPAYAVVCGLRRGWVYYRDSYWRKNPDGIPRPSLLLWLITRFFVPWFAIIVAVPFNLLQPNGWTTDIAATRVHNLASVLAEFACLLILGLYVFRAERSGQYPRFADYFQGKRVLCFIAAVFALLFALYVGGLAQWLRGETVHKKAKLYFVAGESLNGFRRTFPNFPKHPDCWKIRPLNALQRVIFNQAARFVPDDDGEAAAWENRWFWSHYRMTVSMAFSAHYWDYVGRSPGARAVLKKWWRCLEDMGSKPIRDPKVRRDLYMLEYHRLAWNAYENLYLVVPDKHALSNTNHDASWRIYRMTFEEYGAKLAPGLIRLVEEWRRTPENRALIEEHPHAEALGLLTLTLSLGLVMRSEIRAGTFRCENDSARQYLAARQQFFAPETGTAAYLRVWESKGGGINQTDRNGLRTYATEWQNFAQYVLEQRCALKVPGRIVARDCRRFRESDDVTELVQCLEEKALGSNDKELRLMMDKLPRKLQLILDKAPRRAPAAPEPNRE